MNKEPWFYDLEPILARRRKVWVVACQLSYDFGEEEWKSHRQLLEQIRAFDLDIDNIRFESTVCRRQQKATSRYLKLIAKVESRIDDMEQFTTMYALLYLGGAYNG